MSEGDATTDATGISLPLPVVGTVEETGVSTTDADATSQLEQSAVVADNSTPNVGEAEVNNSEAAVAVDHEHVFDAAAIEQTAVEASAAPTSLQLDVTDVNAVTGVMETSAGDENSAHNQEVVEDPTQVATHQAEPEPEAPVVAEYAEAVKDETAAPQAVLDPTAAVHVPVHQVPVPVLEENEASVAAAAAASASILSPSEISAEVTGLAAAAAAAVSLGLEHTSVVDDDDVNRNDFLLSQQIAAAQAAVAATAHDPSSDPTADSANPPPPPITDGGEPLEVMDLEDNPDGANYSHEQHLATRRLKDRQRYAAMTKDQREIYNAKRRDQYHKQTEISRKKRRERERARYHSLEQDKAKDRNRRRAALERDRYKKLSASELAVRNAKRRERAAFLRKQKKEQAAAASATASGAVGEVAVSSLTNTAGEVMEQQQQVGNMKVAEQLEVPTHHMDPGTTPVYDTVVPVKDGTPMDLASPEAIAAKVGKETAATEVVEQVMEI